MLCEFVGGRLNGQILDVETVKAKYCNGNYTEDLTEYRNWILTVWKNGWKKITNPFS